MIDDYHMCIVSAGAVTCRRDGRKSNEKDSAQKILQAVGVSQLELSPFYWHL